MQRPDEFTFTMCSPCFLYVNRYYAVCFLNQVLLSAKESELALRLINIYFSFFKVDSYSVQSREHGIEARL